MTAFSLMNIQAFNRNYCIFKPTQLSQYPSDFNKTCTKLLREATTFI